MSLYCRSSIILCIDLRIVFRNVMRVFWGDDSIEYGVIWGFRGLQVRVGVMEEEAIGSDEVRAEGQVLGIPSTPFNCSCHSPHSAR